MIEIDICDNKAIVFMTTADISVSRIGDVILFINSQEEKFESRKPWKEIFKTTDLESMGGSLSSKVLGDEIIRFKLESFKLNDEYIKIFKNRQLNIAILQSSLKDSLCVANGRFCGYKINLNEAIFDFAVNKSEMIYN